MEDIDSIIDELKEDKKAIKDYLDCFYDINKVKEAFSDDDEFKKIGECLDEE